MPGYNTHRGFNYAVLIVVCVLFYIRAAPFLDIVQFLLLCAGFYVGTEFITPDLDIDSRAFNRWGGLKLIWLPYRMLFKHGKSSHNIVYGAVVRILYFAAVVLLVYYIVFNAAPSNYMILPVEHIFIFLAGIILANALHVMLDAIL